MEELSKDKVLKDIVAIITDLTSDWDSDVEVSSETRILNDLGFSSIDVATMASILEQYYRRSFPFAEFLLELEKKGAQDLKLDQLADFIYSNLNTQQ